MKATGIVRHTDNLGRVVIPKELRRTLGIKEGDPVEIFVNGETVVLKKYSEGCCLCGHDDRPLTNLYPDKPICDACVKRIGKLGKG